MNRDDEGEAQQALCRQVLCRSKGLNPNERLLLQVYAIARTDPSGAVRATAASLAENLGWTPSYFSRVRRDLAEGNWLEEVDKISNSPIFRLGQRATGKKVVVPLRSNTA